MRPTMRRGKTAISGSDFTTKSEVLPYIPRLEATVYPGDFMYDLIHWCLASFLCMLLLFAEWFFSVQSVREHSHLLQTSALLASYEYIQVQSRLVLA